MDNQDVQATRQTKLWFKSRGAWLSALAQFPSGEGPFPTVIMCHGLTNCKLSCPMMNEAAQALLSNGYAVFRFDFFGSGESDGLFQDKTVSIMADNLLDCFSFLSQVKGLAAGRVSIWGRSVGATISILGSYYRRPRALMLLSPPLFLQKTFSWLYESQGRPSYVAMSTGGAATGKVKGDMRLSRAFFEELPYLDERLQEAAASLRTVQIVQGDADRKVSTADAQTIYDLAGDPKDLLIVPGVDHAFEGHQSRIIQMAIDWFQQHSPPRSG